MKYHAKLFTSATLERPLEFMSNHLAQCEAWAVLVLEQYPKDKVLIIENKKEVVRTVVRKADLLVIAGPVDPDGVGSPLIVRPIQ